MTDTPRYLCQPITAEQRNDLKSLIERCLCDDFAYGKKKRKRINRGIFSRQGYAIYTGTDLEMVMERVVLALSFGMDEGDRNETA